MQHPLQQLGFFQSEVNSWGQRTWISLSPRVKQLISLSCRYSENFWRNNYAHVILTSEADSFPTDTWQFLKDDGLVGCHSARSNELSVHAEIWFHRLCSPFLGINRKSNWVFLCVDFWGKNWSETRKALADSSKKTVDTLLSDLGTVALVIEDSDLSMTEDNSAPTARCIQDTKKRERVTRSNLQRLRCCVCHLHHEQALRVPHRVRQVFAQALKKVQHHRVDVVVGDATSAAYRYYQRQEYQALYKSSIAVTLRENSTKIQHEPPISEQTS